MNEQPTIKEKEEPTKMTWKGYLFLLIIFIGLPLLAFWAMDVLQSSPNCWEAPIKGINKETGREAFYSKNFPCKDFHFKNE